MAKRTRKPTIESNVDLSESAVLDMEPSTPADVPTVVSHTVEKPATLMVNMTDSPQMFNRMTGGKTIKPSGTCPIPSNPVWVQFLINHGFVLK